MKNLIKFLCLNALMIGNASLAMHSEDLRLAAATGDCALVQSLIEANAPINAQDTTGQTALLEAAKWGHNEVCQLLMTHNAQAHIQDHNGWTPLRWAAFNRHRETCPLLVRETIQQKVDFITTEYIQANANSLRELTLIHAQEMITSCLNEQVKQLEQDLLKQIDEINSPKLKEDLIALVKEQFEIQQKQKIEDALIEIHPTEKLCEAVCVGNLVLVRKLLAAGISVNARSRNGYTPLHIVACSGHARSCNSALNMILDQQNIRDGIANRKEICQLLLEHNPEIDAKDMVTKKTPLGWAAYCGNKDICQLLLARHAGVDTKDNGDYTPLHLAALFGHYEICQLLLDHQAQVNAKNQHAHTPFESAIEAGNREVCKLFIKTIIDRSISRDTLVALLGIKKFNRSPLIGLVDRNIMTSIARQAWDSAFKEKDVQELLKQILACQNERLRCELHNYAQDLLAQKITQTTALKRQKVGNE